MRFVPPLSATLVLLSLLVEIGGAAAAENAAERPVRAVGRVDLERYAGLWYEVAKIPNKFQKQCAYGTTAEYTLREDGKITVVNRCTKEDGELSEAEGIAKNVGAASNAKLKVSFVSFLGWRPFWGDYWVIGLGNDYQWAVVGEPSREYGWVLSRTPTLDESTLEQVVAVLEQNGYAWSAFETSPPGETTLGQAPSSPAQVVLASCGQCQFGLEGGGCTLAVQIDGQAYYVDGSDIDDHGDAHAADGFCETVREAEVTGSVEDGRFVATSFRLLPPDE